VRSTPAGDKVIPGGGSSNSIKGTPNGFKKSQSLDSIKEIERRTTGSHPATAAAAAATTAAGSKGQSLTIKQSLVRMFTGGESAAAAVAGPLRSRSKSLTTDHHAQNLSNSSASSTAAAAAAASVNPPPQPGSASSRLMQLYVPLGNTPAAVPDSQRSPPISARTSVEIHEESEMEEGGETSSPGGGRRDKKQTFRAKFFKHFFPVKDQVPPAATFSLNLASPVLFSDGEHPDWVMLDDTTGEHRAHSPEPGSPPLQQQHRSSRPSLEVDVKAASSQHSSTTATPAAAAAASSRHQPSRSLTGTVSPERRAVPRLFKMSDFEMGPLVGKGFFSEVHLVTLKTTGEKFALKTIKQLGTSEEKVTFLKEVELLNSLHHPNILRFRGLFVNAQGYHLLTDFVSGGTLRKLLKDSKVDLTNRQRVKIALDISRGMAFLHSGNVLHRDLKSKNVLLLSPDEAVIGDFGLAKILENSDTLTRSIAGSPYWMAPEMLRGEGYSKPVDVFSFGIVLCEIITRLKAEPDVLPRTRDFGLDVELFLPLAKKCPKGLVDLAISCCKVRQELRPSFEQSVTELSMLLRTFEDEKDSPQEEKARELFGANSFQEKSLLAKILPSGDGASKKTTALGSV